MTTTAIDEPVDEAAIGAFAGHLMGLYTGGLITYMIDIGNSTGLFDALAAGPATSGELAARAELDERYVREWLRAMATADIVGYDATTGEFRLPAVQAACLAGSSPTNFAPFSQLNTHLAKHVHEVAQCFRDGGGVSYEAYRPEFTSVMDALGRTAYDELLIPAVLPMADGLAERMTDGIRVADVACGTGHSLVVLGRAFPASTFVGYDLDEDALARGRAEASEAGLTNVTYQACDAATLTIDEPFDAVFVFDAIHDQVDPAAVLRRIHDALAPGGVFVMKEPGVSSRLEDNIGNPFAPMVYAVSTLHCMTVSLAHGGAGLGTAWGQQLALEMLHDAGFGDTAVHPAPGDPMDAVFVSRKAA